MLPMTVDPSEIELLSEIVRRIAKLDRRSIQKLRKVEAKL
jgi:hypothetical protein